MRSTMLGADQVDIRHHFIRENVAQYIIMLKYISTENHLAERLDKALETKRPKYLLQASGIRPRCCQL